MLGYVEGFHLFYRRAHANFTHTSWDFFLVGFLCNNEDLPFIEESEKVHANGALPSAKDVLLLQTPFVALSMPKETVVSMKFTHIPHP